MIAPLFLEWAHYEMRRAPETVARYREALQWIICDLIVGLVVLLGSVRAQAISLDFVPSSQSVPVGNQVSVDLVISGLENPPSSAPSLSTFDLNVLFDSTLLTLDTTDADGDGVIDKSTAHQNKRRMNRAITHYAR